MKENRNEKLIRCTVDSYFNRPIVFTLYDFPHCNGHFRRTLPAARELSFDVVSVKSGTRMKSHNRVIVRCHESIDLENM